MNITIEQYNNVVNGLRTQLELQRDQLAERGRVIDGLRQLRDLEAKRVQEETNGYKIAVGAMVNEVNRLRDSLAACACEAKGEIEPLDSTDPRWSPSYAAVAELRRNHNTVVQVSVERLREIEELQKRRRSRK